VKAKKPPPLSVALISAPWPLYNRPSIQIGSLKAHLKARFPDITVNAHHAYLQIAEAVGYPVYQALSERTWLAESVYAGLLFPEKKKEAKDVFQHQARGKPDLKGIDFVRLVATVEKETKKILSHIFFERMQLVGISVCLCQISASLYFIRQIKRRVPGIRIVLGGSTFSGLSGEALFRFFPEIDNLVHGEGERPLTSIVESLIRKREGKEGISSIQGVTSRDDLQMKAPPVFDQVSALKDLPPPDYEEYFSLLNTFSPGKRFFPTLSLEVSRGCWWRRQARTVKDGGRGCAFCNLNLQWWGYRRKDPGQCAKEVDRVTQKHRVLSVAFTDNILPIAASGALFDALASHGKDYRLFCEIRAGTPKALLEKMHRAGVREVQVGIEALSTPLLKRLNKGTTALENLEIMKHCEALGIKNNSNLILSFPGSTKADVEETLRLLNFAAPLRPLRPVTFWLGRGSPVFRNPLSFGISRVKNHPNYYRLFPRHVADEIPFMIQTYQGGRTYQKKLWRPVYVQIKQWGKEYARLHEDPTHTPILGYSDGGAFLIIRQRRSEGPSLNHRLEGLSRKIYLFCDTIRSVDDILFHFNGLSKERVLPFLKMMVKKRLMVNEGAFYLSLAVRI